VRGSYFTVGSPIKFSDLKPEVTASPLLGQHTDDVLAELGYSKDSIAKMHEAKAV
jgi:formyl-CoA transferase